MSTSDFIFNGRAARVVFGAGSRVHIERELLALRAQKALILFGQEQLALGTAVADQLGSHAAGVFDRATMHVPAELVTEARAVATSLGADCLIAVGGGSAVGLAKAIALESGLPIIALPTTYAGSEMTPIFGVTEAGLKRTGTDLRVLPKTVIYDPELTVTLPVALSVTSGINAIAHAAEGLYSRDANPLTSLMAEEGISALSRSLPRIVSRPDDLSARSDALYGAWLCGAVLGSVGMALHHKLCHTLGGSFNLPHAPTHTIVLPHALAYNAEAAPDAMKRIARAVGHDNAAQGLYELSRANGAPIALKEIGMLESQLDRAADIACNNAYWNPRPLEREAIRTLLQRAFEGSAPQT
ncbi:maleylacetate reductase [Caballeronia mineralivorans]|uniref:maleylacetate reductase n=1 Tax=Caballeronia mineralivorans TaxID=2010198 RepID=UPI002AFF63C1|nr:maleylacetate reductase [Caballeronia mineralivorans]MEA3103677.1 maleylacetate reductase [Caballeronia mineralivorans]